MEAVYQLMAGAGALAAGARVSFTRRCRLFGPRTAWRGPGPCKGSGMLQAYSRSPLGRDPTGLGGFL